MIIGICITVYVAIYYAWLVLSGMQASIFNYTGKCPDKNYTRQSQRL